MGEHGNVTEHTASYIRGLASGPEPNIPAQVRPPEGDTTTTKQNAPNSKIEGHDTISPGRNNKENPVRDAKGDANKQNGHTLRYQNNQDKTNTGPPRNTQNHNRAGHTTSTSNKNSGTGSRNQTFRVKGSQHYEAMKRHISERLDKERNHKWKDETPGPRQKPRAWEKGALERARRPREEKKGGHQKSEVPHTKDPMEESVDLLQCQLGKFQIAFLCNERSPTIRTTTCMDITRKGEGKRTNQNTHTFAAAILLMISPTATTPTVTSWTRRRTETNQTTVATSRGDHEHSDIYIYSRTTPLPGLAPQHQPTPKHL